MKMRRVIAMLALPLAVAACDGSPVDPEAFEGTWVGPRNLFTGPGPKETRSTLVLESGGRYAFEHRVFGDYGRPASELTAYNNVEGRYRITGNRLYVSVERETAWDVSDGGEPVVFVRDGRWGSAGTLSIEGNRLTHRAPAPGVADEPSWTTIVYTRAGVLNP